MKQKRFSGLHMLLAVLGGMLAAILILLLSLRLFLGPQALSLLRAWGAIQTRFVGEYDQEQTVDSALAGMVDGLGDRWSYYLTAEGYAEQNQRRNNAYVGVGVTVDYADERGLRILKVGDGSPAHRAGMAPGEIITAVDGVSLAGEARYEGVDRIQGEEGTSLTLTLLSAQGEERDLPLTREKVESQSASYELLENGVGYVKLENFYTGSAQQLGDAVDALVEQGCRALVFDMRNNGGGYVSELTAMLDHLLPEGPIFRSQTKDGGEEVTMSDASEIDLPMAVLVNADTYSAAEFFAAQLRETVGAAVVGEKTSGKGYSQQAIALPNGGALNLSTAHYTTGQGVSLIGTGVTLDAQVTLGEEEAWELAAETLPHSRDAQLQKALELLEER